MAPGAGRVSTRTVTCTTSPAAATPRPNSRPARAAPRARLAVFVAPALRVFLRSGLEESVRRTALRRWTTEERASGCKILGSLERAWVPASQVERRAATRALLAVLDRDRHCCAALREIRTSAISAATRRLHPYLSCSARSRAARRVDGDDGRVRYRRRSANAAAPAPAGLAVLPARLVGRQDVQALPRAQRRRVAPPVRGAA